MSVDDDCEKLAYAVSHYADRLEGSLEFDSIKNCPQEISELIRGKIKKSKEVAISLKDNDANKMHIIQKERDLIRKALQLIVLDIDIAKQELKSKLNIDLGLESKDLERYRQLSERYKKTDISDIKQA